MAYKKNFSNEEKNSKAMWEKISEIGFAVMLSCACYDIENPESQGQAMKEFNEFIFLLRQAGEKKLYKSREKALREIQLNMKDFLELMKIVDNL